jgi:hypothetical protein
MVPVATGDIVMRMLVERALQPETAAVAGELLQFEGSEFRFKRWCVFFFLFSFFNLNKIK